MYRLGFVSVSFKISEKISNRSVFDNGQKSFFLDGAVDGLPSRKKSSSADQAQHILGLSVLARNERISIEAYTFVTIMCLKSLLS